MAKTSKSQLKSIAKYDAANTRSFTIKMHNRYDADIIEKLSSVPNRQGYIKNLIRNDINPSSVPVPVSVSAMESIQEQAEKTGKSVYDILSCIISESVMRYEMSKSIPVPNFEKEE